MTTSELENLPSCMRSILNTFFLLMLRGFSLEPSSKYMLITVSFELCNFKNKIFALGEIPVKEEVKDNQKIFTFLPEDVGSHDISMIFNGKELRKHAVSFGSRIMRFCL